MISKILNCKKDTLTDFWWCTVKKDGWTAFAADPDYDNAVKKASLRVDSFTRRKLLNPLLQLPGPGYGNSKVTALCGAWQAIFLAAVNVKIKHCQIIPPIIKQNKEPALYARIDSVYSDTKQSPLLRDCSMLKGYPVLGLEINNRLFTGTGISDKEALINCFEAEIIERILNINFGIEFLNTEDESYPPMNPFHTSADDALLDYIDMAEKYGVKPRAKNLSIKDFYIYQLCLETFDKRLCDEKNFMFED